MADIVVTVPKSFRYGDKVGLAAWIAEGCLPGEEDDDPEGGYVFSTWGPRPDIRPGERVYVVCEGYVRGYAPLVELRAEGGRLHFVRGGGAVTVTPRGPDGNPLKVVGFRGWRYTWWPREEEIPFPDWQTYGTAK